MNTLFYMLAGRTITHKHAHSGDTPWRCLNTIKSISNTPVLCAHQSTKQSVKCRGWLCLSLARYRGVQCHELCAILYRTLLQQCRHMVSGRVMTDAQLLGDVFVAVPQQHQLQHFTLPRSCPVRSLALTLSSQHRLVMTSMSCLPWRQIPHRHRRDFIEHNFQFSILRGNNLARG